MTDAAVRQRGAWWLAPAAVLAAVFVALTLLGLVGLPALVLLLFADLLLLPVAAVLGLVGVVVLFVQRRRAAADARLPEPRGLDETDARVTAARAFATPLQRNDLAVHVALLVNLGVGVLLFVAAGIAGGSSSGIGFALVFGAAAFASLLAPLSALLTFLLAADAAGLAGEAVALDRRIDAHARIRTARVLRVVVLVLYVVLLAFTAPALVGSPFGG